jgi:acetyl esterase/lipase
MHDYSVDPKRVFVSGLSAGGAAAAIMASTYSDLYPAVGIHSGLPCGAADDMPPAFAAMRQGGEPNQRVVSRGQILPAIIFHGDSDSTVHPNNGKPLARPRPKRGCFAGRYLEGTTTRARPTPPANDRSWSIGTSTAPATPGLGAARPAPIRIHRGRTRRKKCCGSSCRVRNHRSQHRAAWNLFSWIANDEVTSWLN